MKQIKAGKIYLENNWLEYLLNLSAQGYLAECYDEIQDTDLNTVEAIHSFVFPNLAKNLIEDYKRGVI